MKNPMETLPKFTTKIQDIGHSKYLHIPSFIFKHKHFKSLEEGFEYEVEITILKKIKKKEKND